MDVSTANMMLMMLQMQQMNAAWQIGSTQGDQSGLGNSNTSMLLFSLLLQSALADSTGEAQESETETPSQSSTEQKGQGETKYNQLILSMSGKYGIDPSLIREVVEAESSYDPNALSSSGAQGLMQLMPGTAASYGVTDPYDPIQNLDGGTHFLRDLLNRFNGNTQLALAAYNAGPGAVDKYQGIPPYQETQNYVKKIMGQLGFDKEI